MILTIEKTRLGQNPQLRFAQTSLVKSRNARFRTLPITYIYVNVKDGIWRMSTFSGECPHTPNTSVKERKFD